MPVKSKMCNLSVTLKSKVFLCDGQLPLEIAENMYLRTECGQKWQSVARGEIS